MTEEAKYFKGPWRVIKADTLKDQPRLQPGQILKHRSGNLILNCPVCNAMQFVIDTLLDSRESPTLRKEHQCGAGMCQRCAVWFTVLNGRTKLVSEPPKKSRKPDLAAILKDTGREDYAEVAKKLDYAGVAGSPELADQIKKAEELLKKRGS